MLEYLLLASEVVWVKYLVLEDSNVYRCTLEVVGHELFCSTAGEDAGDYATWSCVSGVKVKTIAQYGNLVLVQTYTGCYRYENNDASFTFCRVVNL